MWKANPEMEWTLCWACWTPAPTRYTSPEPTGPAGITQKDAREITEIKPTKVAIGGYTDNDQVFEKHTVALQKEDCFYLFSDGFTDQFGGPSGKKLMTKKLKEVLIEIQHLSMYEQEAYLNDYFTNWKSGFDQIDDILIIGIRV